MEVKNKKRKFNTKLTVALLLTVCLSCTPSNAINTTIEPQNSELLTLADDPILPISKDYNSYLVSSKPDFSLLELTPAKPIKLINPLYLDTTKTAKPVIKTLVPFNPNSENTDADYFSSEIDDPQAPQANKEEENSVKEEKSDFFSPPTITEDTSPEIKSDDTYVVEVNEDNTEHLNLEGKIINNIDF